MAIQDTRDTAGTMSPSQIGLWGPALAVTAFGALFSLVALGFPALTGIDDANITQVYGRNLAAGAGFVYVPGGETVEGFTSLLWTLINAAAFALFTWPEAALFVVCLALTAGSVVLTLSLARDLGGDAAEGARMRVGITALAMAVQIPFFAWSVWTLMDLTLWIFLILLLIRLLAEALHAADFAAPPRRPRALAVTAALLTLTRPEGVAVAAGLCALAGLMLAVRGERRGSWLAPIAGLLAAGGVGVALTLWRLAVFGYPVPNTFYAKVPQDLHTRLGAGLSYLVDDFLLAAPVLLTFLLGWCLVFAQVVRRAPPRGALDQARVLIVVAIGGLLAMYVALGGDHFALYRFYQPAVPLLALAPALFLVSGPSAPLPGRWGTRTACGLVLVALVPTVFSTMKDISQLARDFRIAAHGRALGDALNALEDRPSVGVIAAGGIARTYAGPIFDLMGLNWVAMAHADRHKTGAVRNHAGFSPDVFWQARPDLVVVSPMGPACPPSAPVPPTWFQKAALKGLTDDPAFLEAYRPGQVTCRLVYVRMDAPTLRPIQTPVGQDAKALRP